jgi:hypothetical protein
MLRIDAADGGACAPPSCGSYARPERLSARAHRVDDSLINVGKGFGIFVVDLPFQEAINQGPEQHRSLHFHSRGLTDLQANTVQCVDLVRSEHYHHFFDFVVRQRGSRPQD